LACRSDENSATKKTKNNTSTWGSKKLKDDVERLKEELKDEGAQKSNFTEILSYAKPEFLYIFIGLATICGLGKTSHNFPNIFPA
jgi:hypothetical protein